MTDLPEARPRRWPPRRRTVAWVTALALLVAVIATIWATGGFGTDAKPFLGSRVQAGEVVKTRFWDVVVHEAEVSEPRGEIRVAITATNKQRRTALSLTTNMLVIRLPDGTPMWRSSCTSLRGMRFGPLIPADAECVFRFEDNDVLPQETPEPGGFDIEFIVLDQELSNNLVTTPEPQAGEPAGWLPMTVRVAPEEEA